MATTCCTVKMEFVRIAYWYMLSWTNQCKVFHAQSSGEVAIDKLKALVCEGVDASSVVTFEIGFDGRAPAALPTDNADLSSLLTLCAGADQSIAFENTFPSAMSPPDEVTTIILPCVEDPSDSDTEKDHSVASVAVESRLKGMLYAEVAVYVEQLKNGLKKSSHAQCRLPISCFR